MHKLDLISANPNKGPAKTGPAGPVPTALTHTHTHTHIPVNLIKLLNVAEDSSHKVSPLTGGLEAASRRVLIAL